MAKHPHGVLLEIPPFLFARDDHLPAGPRGQLENGRLWTQGIERENVEKAAALEIRQPGEQSPRRGVLALARLQPLDGQQWFHGAADDLAADGAVIILNLFDGIAIAVFALEAPLQTAIAATTATGQDFDAIKGGGDVALAASPVENFVAFELAVDADQHLLQRIEREPA